MKEIAVDQINGNISCVYGLDELILLKWLQYPKLSTDSIQPISKLQCHFFTEIGKKKTL